MNKLVRWLPCLGLALLSTPALAGSQGSSGKASTFIVRMDYADQEERFATDGSKFTAKTHESPAVVDGKVVLRQPWPSRVDIKRYADKNGNSLFYYEKAQWGQRVVKIDVGVVGHPPRHKSAFVIRFNYDAAGNLLEVSNTQPAQPGRSATLERDCFVYSPQGKLIAYAPQVDDTLTCQQLKSHQFRTQFVHDADGQLERVIQRDMALSNSGKAQQSVRVTVYDTSGTVAGQIEDAGGAAVQLPAKISSESIHQGYGVVTVQGDVLLRTPLPLDGDQWKVVRTRDLNGLTDSLFAEIVKPESVLAQGTGDVQMAESERTELARQVRAYPGRIFLHWRARAKALYPALEEQQWAKCTDARQHGPEACGVSLGEPANGSPTASALSATDLTASLNWAVQDGFSKTHFADEYAIWQEAFVADLNDIAAALEGRANKRAAVAEALAQGLDKPALAKLFANSIADTPKGRSLKRFIIEGWKQPAREGAAPPVSSLFIRQVLGNPYLEPGKSTTRVVGYGGRFQDGDFSSEAFYLLPTGLESLRPGSTDPSKAFQFAVDGLAGLELPAYGVLKRNVWPMTLFVREPSGKLRLYGMTQEMFTISTRLQTAAMMY